MLRARPPREAPRCRGYGSGLVVARGEPVAGRVAAALGRAVGGGARAMAEGRRGGARGGRQAAVLVASEAQGRVEEGGAGDACAEHDSEEWNAARTVVTEAAAGAAGERGLLVVRGTGRVRRRREPGDARGEGVKWPLHGWRGGRLRRICCFFSSESFRVPPLPTSRLGAIPEVGTRESSLIPPPAHDVRGRGGPNPQRSRYRVPTAPRPSVSGSETRFEKARHAPGVRAASWRYHTSGE